MRLRNSLTAIAFFAIMMGAIGASAAVSASTPLGHGSHDCVRSVPNGSTVDPYSGKVELANGTVVKASSIPCMSGTKASTTGNEAYGYLTVSSSYYYTNFQDSWTVPNSPTNGAFSVGMADIFWDGLQNSNGIEQPILIYGCIEWNIFNQCVEGSNTAWYIYDYSDVGGSVYISSAIAVSPGDSIYLGEIQRDPSLTFCSGNGPGYSVDVEDITIGKAVDMAVCDNNQYTDAIAGSFEVHSISSCNQLPNSSSDAFSSISFTTSPSGASPSYGTGYYNFCSVGASWNSGDTTLTLSWTP